MPAYFHFIGETKSNLGPSLAGWQVEVVNNSDLSTVIPIYADENATPIASASGVTNRAVSDANGNYDFFVPEGKYGLRFYNASGVYQRTTRAISMFGFGSSFTQSGTGASTRTLQDKAREGVSVLDFHPTGIIGANTTDDTAAINAAIDTGRDVFFPAGHYSYTPSAKQLLFGQTLFATSPLNTTINKVANGDMFTLAAGCGLQNIGLQGNGSSFTGRGLLIPANSANITLQNVNILDMAGYCAEVTANNGGSQLRVIGGLFDRTDTSLAAWKLPAGDTQASPRTFTGVNSSGVLLDFAGADNTIVTGGYTRNFIYSSATKKALVSGTRVSTLGQTLSILGTDNDVSGGAIAGSVEFGYGAVNCRFSALMAAGFTFTDNSGTTSNWASYNYRGSATYDPPSLVDGAGATTTVTCTGAKLGMYARAAFSLDLQGITVTAYVSAANTVTVRFQNESGGTLDLASGTLSVQAFA